MDCKHTNTELRRMTHCNQIKLQCFDCGMSVGNAIKQSEISSDELEIIQEFDYEFRDVKKEERDQQYREAKQERESEWYQAAAERKQDYSEYLRSEEWRLKREKVIQRDRGICQGCLEMPIHDIHHLTYNNRGDELVFQLVGLCRRCHEKTHKIKSA